MSICKGVAGNRGGNPKGIIMHNDAGSKYANAAHYRNWLPTHDLENGFAHAYCCDDGILVAEDDWNAAWHCGNYYYNMNFLGVEMCQSMGDLETFKKNEEKALVWCAEKCKKYGITPNNETIKLHQEVSATACPHRSVEIHGGRANTKAYYIKRIKELMNGNAGAPEYVQGGESIPAPSGDAGVVFAYAVRLEGGTILPEVRNLEDFAGIRGKRITDVVIKVNKGSVRYRVHILGGGWLPWVTGYNWGDHNNGYAGNGRVIDAIQVYYDTPSDIVSKYGYQKAQYRISPVNGNYYPWQFDDETGNGQDGYAGAYGVAMDRFQLY